MKKFTIILLLVLLCCAVLSFSACGDKLKDGEIRITVGDKSFIAELSNTEAAKEFKKLLPLTLEMNSVSGQLYNDIPDTTFPEQHDTEEPMRAGDVALEGNNRLVMFYAFGNVSPTMTRIASVKAEDKEAFVEAVDQALASGGSRKITVKISK